MIKSPLPICLKCMMPATMYVCTTEKWTKSLENKLRLHKGQYGSYQNKRCQKVIKQLKWK